MYTHIRSQASDWNCCVKRLFVCTTVHIPYSTYHVKTNPSQMRDRDGREKDIERQEREKEIGRETGVRERDRQTDRQRERDRGEREKITKTKKFMEFYHVLLHSAEQSEALQSIVARQVSCYNPLSCFNPVTVLTLQMC